MVLERASIEWNEHQMFKLRVGNWFTPFGIWNEDHGSPTLIATTLPQFILQRLIPIRQTGLMGYGNAFLGEWELGYMLTFSNGRQELSNFNFEDKFGYGGRLYLRRETGALNSTFGVSYFTGTTSDRTVDLVDALFSDELSTSEKVSEMSGRGVGMSAVRDAARQLNGNVSVLSEPNAGTTVRFRFPVAEATKPNDGARYPGARPSLVPLPTTKAATAGKVSVA